MRLFRENFAYSALWGYRKDEAELLGGGNWL